eukprot:672303-Rhodomonas_salina.2
MWDATEDERGNGIEPESEPVWSGVFHAVPLSVDPPGNRDRPLSGPLHTLGLRVTKQCYLTLDVAAMPVLLLDLGAVIPMHVSSDSALRIASRHSSAHRARRSGAGTSRRGHSRDIALYLLLQRLNLGPRYPPQVHISACGCVPKIRRELKAAWRLPSRVVSTGWFGHSVSNTICGSDIAEMGRLP